MPSLNPDILRWARETAGLTLEEAANKLAINEARGTSGAERLASYESGEREPTRPLLLRMAKQYRRPLLAFYMSEAPRTGQRGQDFRTLPPEHSRAQDAVVDTLIRDVRARQEMVRAILEDEEEADRLPFVGSMSMSDGVESALLSIQRTLDLDIHQYRGRRLNNQGKTGFAYLRQQTERAGIFVLLIGNLGSHHTNIDVELFRGLALADDVAPFIVINDQDAETAWAFTLMHELCHIWLGATGVSGANASTGIEQFCNDVAGRFFIAADELGELRSIRGTANDSAAARVSDFADRRQVSRSMVAYKLYKEGFIDHDQWRGLSGMFRAHWLRAREEQRDRNRHRDGGPSFYLVKRHRLGDALVNLTRRVLADRVLTPSKAGKILGVKPSNVYTLVSGDVDPPRMRKVQG